jgi:hypothetical protein
MFPDSIVVILNTQQVSAGEWWASASVVGGMNLILSDSNNCAYIPMLANNGECIYINLGNPGISFQYLNKPCLTRVSRYPKQ